MHITTFTQEHIEQAIQINRNNYQQERIYSSQLPVDFQCPDFTPFVENGLGVAALEDGRLIGYLCGVGPFTGANAFGGTIPAHINGVFSPLHGHGTNAADNGKIYQKLYEMAGQKWVEAGAVNHGISFYSHEKEGLYQFFLNGFGMRCVDAIRTTEAGVPEPHSKYEMLEIKDSLPSEVSEMKKKLRLHMSSSPTFMKYHCSQTLSTGQDFENGDRFFIARMPDGKIAAFLQITEEGETFLTPDPHIRHICGAYCLPEYRRSGITYDLLYFLLGTLREEGIAYLGVDFESINPPAYGFWTKHFSTYSVSVVRRIDENILTK